MRIKGWPNVKHSQDIRNLEPQALIDKVPPGTNPRLGKR